MEVNTISAELLAKCFLAGAKSLEAEKEYINELNVFPVPDGDTGTNMTMTIMSAAKEVAALENPDMRTISKAISSGSLRGARGNSGVILSQLFRGFTKVIKTQDEINIPLLCEAMQKAVETAYKAVMKPKEGTILTVARAAADKALELVDSAEDLLSYCEAIVEAAEETLKRTPEMLPVLKQAGVVDSGGQGLLQVLKGAVDMLSGKEIDISLEVEEEKKSGEQEVKFAYKTAFTVKLTVPLADKKRAELQAFLESAGDHVDLSFEKTAVQIKIETDDPGRLLSKAIVYGSLHEINIENQKDEAPVTGKKTGGVSEAKGEKAEASQKIAAEEKPVFSEPPKEMGFITVSTREGLSGIFTELGADYVIEGGQTMNPSTDDILKALDHVNAKNVFVLPNNKNIILAANQAAMLSKDKKLLVIPTRTIPQGITALINFMEEQSPENNLDRMTLDIKNVKSGQVTHAVRDTIIDDKEISEGDFMGIGDSGILSVNKKMDKAFLSMLDEMVDEDSGMISIYYGCDVKEKDAEVLTKKVQKKFPDIEVDLKNGGQAVYYYIASVE